MSSAFPYIHLCYLAIAIMLDVIANIFMKFSNGFKHKHFACLAIVCALLAFTALSFAIQGIQLSVAYGVWGGLGLILTALAGIVLFKEHIRIEGWLGIALVIGGVVLLKLSHFM